MTTPTEVAATTDVVPSGASSAALVPVSAAPSRLTTIAAAARNAWAISPFGEGIEKYDGLPAEVLHDEPHRQLRRYLRSTPATTARPVLLVPPLAVATNCYDLRPGQSLAEHLLEQGHETYVVDYGDITFADRNMGFEDWIDDILPTAIARVSALHDGAPVDVVAWSLGGTVSLLTAAAHPTLPIASITAFGTPIDYRLIPAVQLLRYADRVLGSTLMTAGTALMGGVPRHLTRASFRAMAPVREITKPWFLARNILDTEVLARTEAIDQFIASMPGYPGRFYNQLHTRLVTKNELFSGVINLTRSRAVRLSAIRTRVLFVGSRTDAIANGPAVEAGTRSVPGARYAAADGLSHLGLVAGVDARDRAWKHLDAFLAEV
ncbi:alpha/beta hydrolase [Nocardioides cavernaquae]|uniref:alpha/beta hydrolase n=1 Tax=Nocardioides cavernaquae TaxID=2321396 RepID=UPI001EE5FEC7|nr:alpha/beta hydrolase [Nocardioides cavernaquae]